MIRFIPGFFLLIFTLQFSIGQELNCIVEIEHSKTQSTDPKVFETLKSSITEFLNNRKWTDDIYKPHEKIDCSIIINITSEISSNEFAGEFLIRSERPVYNTNYKTIVFSHKDDKFKFEYNQFDNLEFSDNTYFSNLTSFLAYYAYIVIGYDYETFEPDGGTPYFLKAQDVVNAIPGGEKGKYEGWNPFDGSRRNRFVLVDNLLNSRYKIYREALHMFHFAGLDKMYEDTENSRKVISNSISLMKRLYDDNPSSMLLKVFYFSKGDEIVEIFSKASNSEKDKIIETLSKMDPTNAKKYEAIRKS